MRYNTRNRKYSKILGRRKYLTRKRGNSILASRRKRKSVVAGTRNFKTPDKGFLTAYMVDDMLTTFEEFLKNNVDQYDIDELSTEELWAEYGSAYSEHLTLDYEYIMEELEPAVEDCNYDLRVYEIKIHHGYYEGFQLYIDEKSEWYLDYETDEDGDPVYLEDEDEVREQDRIKANEMIKKLAKEFGLEVR